jgi:hypothetical protein
MLADKDDRATECLYDTTHLINRVFISDSYSEPNISFHFQAFKKHISKTFQAKKCVAHLLEKGTREAVKIS